MRDAYRLRVRDRSYFEPQRARASRIPPASRPKPAETELPSISGTAAGTPAITGVVSDADTIKIPRLNVAIRIDSTLSNNELFRSPAGSQEQSPAPEHRKSGRDGTGIDFWHWQSCRQRRRRHRRQHDQHSHAVCCNSHAPSPHDHTDHRPVANT
jgi:hypothetical protein